MERESPARETRLRLGGWSILAAPGVDGASLGARVLEALPRLEPSAGKEALASGLPAPGEVLRWRAHRAAMLFREGPLGHVHVKVYRPKDALEVLLEILLPSRGGTSWRMGRKLLGAGVPTPAPLLLAVRKPFRLHRGTVLLTRPLDAPVLLADELARLQSMPDAAAAARGRRLLLRDVARLAASLHEAGFFHGDFVAHNVVASGPDGARTLSLIDLDRAKDLRLAPAPFRRWLQCLDLRLLLLTTWRMVPRRAWLRMLAEYLRARKLPPSSRKKMAARVLSARRGRIRLGARVSSRRNAPWS